MRACTRRSVRIRTEGYGVGAARGHAHRCHGRACPGHPRLSRHHAAKTCLTGSADGTLHAEGDKDLKLKGSSTVLKRGTMIRGIHLIADEIEGRADKVKGLVLCTELLKKA
jgi:protein PhnA